MSSDYISITNIISKYNLEQAKKRKELFDLFRLLDIRHSNQISAVKFQRAFHLADIRMDPSELQLLSSFFAKEQSSDIVDYIQFLNIAEKGFEQDHFNIEQIDRFFTRDELKRKESLLNNLQQMLLARKLTIQDVFQEEDFLFLGIVEEPVFASVLLNAFEMSESSIDLLIRYYQTTLLGIVDHLELSSSHNYVDYLTLHNEIHQTFLAIRGRKERLTRLLAKKESESLGLEASEDGFGDSGRRQPPSRSITELEARIGRQLIENRLDLRDYFTFDPKKTGECSTNQFGQAIARCFRNKSFQQEELNRIMDKYLNRYGTRVRFREFLKRMDFVLKTLMEEEENHVIQPHVHELPETNPGLSVRFARMKEMEESKKLASLDPPSPFREESKRSSSSNTARSRTKPQTPSYLPESELSPLEQVMHDIRMKMYLKRMNINPVLRDFDTRGEFHITTAQFLRVLSMFDLMPSSEEEQRLLIEKYAPGDLKRAKGEFIHYRKFLEDMENVQSTDTIATYVSLSHQTIKTREVIPFPSEEKEPPKDLFVGVASRSSEHVWSVLLRDFDNNRSMLANAFRDQDSFNEGSISQAKFGRAITTCNFRLGYKELNDLCERYKDSSIRDSLGKPYVFWNDFFQELEDRHQLLVERLESDHSSPCPGAPELEMTEEEIEIANECLSWLVDKARRNRRDIFLAFLDLDEHRKGIISISLLERALSMLDLLPLPEQIQALAKRFGERKIDDQIDVNYRALIKAMEMIESGETTPSEAVGPDGYRQLIRAGKKNWKHGTTMRKTGLVDAICYEDEEQGEKLREELHQTMREISRQLCARQTDIRPFFRRMDAKRKTGELSSFRFRSAFTNAGLVLSEREFRLIEEMFNGDRDAHFVHYKKFLASLDDYIRETTDMPRGDEDEDEVDFGEEGEGGEEEGKTISSTHQETKGLGMRVRKDINGKIILQWSENGTVDFYGNEGLERLILKIDAHFIRNRIHITPFFHDYDRCHNNKVSLQQFISVLVSVGIPISPQEQDLLVLAFGAAGGHHEGVLIAYEHFTSVVRSTNKREKIRELRSGKHTPQTPMISNLSL